MTTRCAGMLCAVIFVAAAAANAQTKEEFEELKQQLRALQEKTERLEKRLAEAETRPRSVPAKTVAAPKSAAEHKAVVERIATASVTADESGFLIKSADDNFRLRIGGLIHADGRFPFEDGDRDDVSNTFLLRRVRPIFEGKIFGDYGFRIMPEFGEGRPAVLDAYLEYTRYEAAQLRIGKFKPPVGLERLQSSSDLFFVERGLPTSLLPNRDVGVQLSGSFADKAVNYQLGVFNGVVDGSSGDFDTNDAFDLAARIWLQPFKTTKVAPIEGLQIGIAGTAGEQDGPLPTYRTAGQQAFFSYNTDVVADGTRWRVTPQAYYSWGPFGLLAEYAHSEQEVRSATGLTTDVGASAWQVLGTFVLTGEQASYRGVKPKRNFGDGGFGSLELVARYGELQIDDDTFSFGLANPTRSARAAQSFALGLNWNLNRNVRAMLNYSHTIFDGGALLGDRPDEDVILTRLQLAF